MELLMDLPELCLYNHHNLLQLLGRRVYHRWSVSHARGMVTGSRGAQGYCSRAECGDLWSWKGIVECDGKVFAMISAW